MSFRREEEFYCDVSGGGCGFYFLTYLRSNTYSNMTIQCPGCGHHHFRVVEGGLVTKDRHDERYGQTEVVIGLKATLQKNPWTDDADFKRKQQMFLARSAMT